MNKSNTQFKVSVLNSILSCILFIVMKLPAFSQGTNYTGEYEIISGPGQLIKVIHNGSDVKIFYRGDEYESSIDGSKLTGFVQQGQSWVGENAKCYQRILNDQGMAIAFRKQLIITFEDGEIKGSIRIPKFICKNDKSIEIIPGLETRLKLNRSPNDLYWITRNAVLKCNVGDPGSKLEVISGLTKGNNIALDEDGSLLFYQDGDTIYSANTNGSNKVKLIAAPAHSSIRHLAVDGKKNILFWSENYSLYRYDYPSGNVRRKKVLTQQHPTHWLALDKEHQKIYWTSHYTDTIYRVNYNGHDLEYFTTDTADYINIDPKDRVLYCADYKGVRKIGLDSGTSEKLITGLDYERKGFNDPTEFYFDKDFNRLYFFGRSELYKANTKNFRIISTKLGFFWNVMGIALHTGMPNSKSIDPDIAFNLWTLIRQQ